tara:strand:- start:509 stop:661 length:153 start_codon:yes stop_codon:yes gene_type:complete
MKLEITKPNGTLLTKEIDSKDENYIVKLKKIGWKEVKPVKAKKMSKKKAK